MMIQKRYRLVGVLAVCLILSLFLTSASFAVESKESQYLSYYKVGITAKGNGKVRIWGDVYADCMADEIGVAVVEVYEGDDPQGSTWTHRGSYYYNLEATMAGTNDNSFHGYTDHYGTAGMYYKAYVTIYVEYNNITESRGLWAAPVQAT